MKNNILILVLGLTMIFSCQAPKVYWENLNLQMELEGIVVDITYPYVFGGVDSTYMNINDTIRRYYTTWIIDDCNLCSIDSAVMMLYKQKKADSTLVRIEEYNLYGNGSHFVKGDTISVYCSKKYYLGGANNMNNSSYLNFDIKTGQIIPVENIITEDRKAVNLIGQYLKANYPPQDGYSMFFKNIDIDNPPMPKMVGLDSVGYVFLYNIYEIAPRSTGIITITIPYSELK